MWRVPCELASVSELNLLKLSRTRPNSRSLVNCSRCQAAVEPPPTLQIIDKQWDPRCREPSTHWNCACFMPSRAGMGSSAETTNIWEMVRSGFACLSRTLPLAISIGAGRDIDTSIANRGESRRDPHSTSERERTLHDWKSRLLAAFPVPSHLLVRANVLGETA
jgi:hypothetical protein